MPLLQLKQVMDWAARNRGQLGAFAIVALLLAGFIQHERYLSAHQLYFVVDMEVSQAGVSQVFFDLGKGHNEQDSQTLSIERRKVKRYAFPLPLRSIQSLRFDPVNRSADVRIRAAWIENRLGKLVRKLRFEELRPVQHIDKASVQEGALRLEIPENANDPILNVEGSRFDQRISDKDFLKRDTGAVLGIGALLLLALTALRYFVSLLWKNPRVVKSRQNLSGWVVAHPKKCIALVGLVAALICCYPVVFFGKSFVSPACVASLYPYPPFLPGFPLDAPCENFRLSDIGVSAWSSIPNTFVQIDALFQHGEFPLWSRYAGGGIPLFAQGQSFIGDVLHWLVIAMGGSAGGWDLKFVLGKALFAMGMGILVFGLTSSLLAGCLIAISSCFIGFYAFRFNHPAYFVLPYAPWIILQWEYLGRVLAQPYARPRTCLLAVALLLAVTWLQFNAGAPKEGVITAAFMHALGAFVFIVRVQSQRGWIRATLLTAFFGLALIMAMAPYWLIFLDALRKSFTFYDIPGAVAFPLWKLLGFFDNFYFQQVDVSLAPSTNLFVLLGVAAALTSLVWYRSSISIASSFLFLLALASAYGLVPPSILMSIPFINNIQHIWNTFSVPMIPLGLLVAGLGIHHFLIATPKRRAVLLGSGIFLFLLLLHVHLYMTWKKDSLALGLSLFGVVVLMLWPALRLAETRPVGKGALALFLFCFVMLHIRHGMHLMTSNQDIDTYVQNPAARADFSAKSSAVAFVQKRLEETGQPTRVIGEGPVMFPAVNATYLLEGIVPCEAIRNGYFDKLLTLIDFPMHEWKWLFIINADQIPSRSAALDLLNIGYVLAEPGKKMPEDMKLVHSGDLDVWERTTVWPRAYFVDRVQELQEPADITRALARAPHVPFAAVESQEIPADIPRATTEAAKVIPASQYTLTNNTTRFTVEASGPGLIVLGEAYYPEDFVVTLDGERVDYLRVNHSFKGVWVRQAGKHEVKFTYRPAKLTLSLGLSACGLLLSFALATLFLLLDALKNRRRAGSQPAS